MRFRPLLVLASLLATPSLLHAAEVVQLNDSTTGGTPSTVGNFFIAGESAAAWLVPSCDGDLVAMQVYWASQFGGAPLQTESALTLYSAGSFPTPGSSLASIPGPSFADGVMNEFRFLDPPTNSVPLQIPVTAGHDVVVSLRFLLGHTGSPFESSVSYDQDGCQTGANAVDAIPGGWTDACLAGVTGDWVIRAIVDCQEPGVPALDAPIRPILALSLAVGGALAILSLSPLGALRLQKRRPPMR